jgi:hypothetical protein
MNNLTPWRDSIPGSSVHLARVLGFKYLIPTYMHCSVDLFNLISIVIVCF